MGNRFYNSTFYLKQMENSYRSARLVLEYILTILHPESIADFGCGVGTWLKAAKELGVKDLVGIDGSWARDTGLLDPGITFIDKDLNEQIDIGRRFDLVISLEVAEHLNPERSRGFVDDIARHSEIVLFGSAIPGQGGENHINERYQDFWIDCFAENGFLCVDCIRPVFWDNENIGVAYKQNAFLYIKEGIEIDQPDIQKHQDPQMKNLVHPMVFERYKDHHEKFLTSLKNIIKHMLFMK